MFAERFCVCLDFAMNFRQRRHRRTHDVSIHVATGRQRVHQRLIDSPDGSPQVSFDNAVKLKRLSCRQPNGAVRPRPGYLVHVQPLIRCTNTTRHSGANHETVCGLEALPFSFVAHITIILLVDAVKFRQLCVVFRNRAGKRIFETFNKSAAQVATPRLYALDVAWICCHAGHTKLLIDIALIPACPAQIFEINLGRSGVVATV